MEVEPIPNGFNTITPYFLVEEVEDFIKFLEDAFNAIPVSQTIMPGGVIMHAQVKIGNSIVMMGEAKDHWKPMPASTYLYVNNVDALYEQAMSAGGVSINKPRDEFYGDRTAGVQDPFGNYWWIATHVEDVTPEELKKRLSSLL